MISLVEWHGATVLKQNNLSIQCKTTVCQQIPVDLMEKLTSHENNSENMIGADFIVNMGEVPLSFDMPLAPTINTKGESSVLIRTTDHEKSNFTVMLSCTMSGKKATFGGYLLMEIIAEGKIPTRDCGQSELQGVDG